eukprot:6354897-Lingulodinium_polyedra.AAC.1
MAFHQNSSTAGWVSRPTGGNGTSTQRPLATPVSRACNAFLLDVGSRVTPAHLACDVWPSPRPSTATLPLWV